jgi:thiol:disulfide interchange protein DsbA
MKRRDFVSDLGYLSAGAFTLAPTFALAQAKTPQLDVDYKKLDKPAPVDTPAGKIELIEFFWYSCPHCNAFEPILAAWAKRLPKDVAFKRVPIAFRDDFVPQQRLFYALEAMGLVEKLHARVFAAIHDEKQNLSKAETITDWVVKQGVNKAKFLEQFNAFTATTKATRAKQLQDAYRLDGVPALGVAGRFYTDGAMAQSMENALQVTEFLISEVRRGR